MPAPRVTTVTVPVGVRSGVAFEFYRDRTPLLTICTARPPLLVTLTLPERVELGHVQFARQLALLARRYAAEVERRWHSQPAQASAPRRAAMRGVINDHRLAIRTRPHQQEVAS